MPETVRTPIFSRYELIDELGSGGMGTVYKARQKFVGRLVAFKVLPPALRQDAEALERFEREAAALGRLSHPNVVTVFDAGVEGGFPYLAMEYVEGQNLRQMLQEGPMPLAEIVRMGIAMAEALDYVQGRGLVHRDIKPSNIMRTPEGRYVLTDFGIAFAAAMPRITQGAMGTPEFMSPEQAEGHTLDIRSDLYSLGVVLYECLAGTMPFQRKDESLTSLSNLIHRVLHDPPTPVKTHRPDTPPWLADAVQRCMAKKPDERFQTGADLAAALRQETVSEAPPPPKTNARPVSPPAPAAVATPPSAPSPPAETAQTTPPRPPKTQRERPSPAITPPRRAPQAVTPPGTQTGPPFDTNHDASGLPAKREDKKAASDKAKDQKKEDPKAASKTKQPRARVAFLAWMMIGMAAWGYLFITAEAFNFGGLYGLNLFCLTPALTGALTTLFSRSKQKKSKVARGIFFGVFFGFLLSAALMIVILDIPLDTAQFDYEALLVVGGLCLASTTISAFLTGLVLKIRSLFASS